MISVPSGLGETVRVSAWNLQDVTDEPLLNQVAAELRSLRPEVILLQGVTDWRMSTRLAEALQPERYNVLICSSFRNSGERAAMNKQVAVLARGKADFSWSELWHGSTAGGGFVFVAVPCQGQRLGFISAALGQPIEPEGIIHQLRQQTDAVARWEVNRVQSFVIGLSCRSADETQHAALQKVVLLLQDAGYSDTLDALADDQRITVSGTASRPGSTSDFLLAQPTVFPSPQRPRTSVMGRYPVTCDLELDPARAAAAWTARARELQLRARAFQLEAAARSPNSAPLSTAPQHPPAWWWFIGGAMAMALLFLLWFISRTARRMPPPGTPLLVEHAPLQLTSASSYTLVSSAPHQLSQDQLTYADQSRTSSSPQTEMLHVQVAGPADIALQRKLAGRISRWLKQKFVRRLIAERAGLLETHRTAASRARAVDERLARIEQQIQQQTADYERRIEALTLELAAAREDNREFIRARIAQIKLEMDSVHARLRAQGREDADSHTA